MALLLNGLEFSSFPVVTANYKELKGWWEVTESEWLRLGGTSGSIWSNPPAQAGPPTASCPEPHPDGFWVSPSIETPPHLRATCASARSPSQRKKVSWGSEGASCVSVCACCLRSCHWASLERAWLHRHCTLPLGIDKVLPEPSIGWTVPALSAFLYRSDAPVPSSSW